mmetsp:Transcript_13613/g.30003  ORF Transcript_13613/g.30003 Transcript_13613/m.30003 type:complete len:542 (-) Transcript_13613:56-1681(-)
MRPSGESSFVTMAEAEPEPGSERHPSEKHYVPVRGTPRVSTRLGGPGMGPREGGQVLPTAPGARFRHQPPALTHHLPEEDLQPDLGEKPRRPCATSRANAGALFSSRSEGRLPETAEAFPADLAPFGGSGMGYSSAGRIPHAQAGSGPSSSSGSGSKFVTVNYGEGEEPMQDLRRLGGGLGFPVIVEMVARGGRAFKAGVRVGYSLTAMNGRGEFTKLPGWQVRLLLEAPISLLFDSAPVIPDSSKCTEIRLSRDGFTSLGFPPRAAVFGPQDSGYIAEEVILRPNKSSIWLEARGEAERHAASSGRPMHSSRGHPSKAGPAMQSVRGRAVETGDRDSAGPKVYELHRRDAHDLVGRAVSDLPHPSGSLPGHQRPSRSTRSPLRYCSGHCTGSVDVEEVDGNGDIVRENPLTWHSPRANSPTGAAMDLKPWWFTEGTERSRTAHQRSFTSNDTSPLRWLAPMIATVASMSPFGSPRSKTYRSPEPGSRSPGLSMRSPSGHLRPTSPKPMVPSGDLGLNDDFEAVIIQPGQRGTGAIRRADV